MTSWFTALGLRAPQPGEGAAPPLIAHFILFQYFWAHAGTAPRVLKGIYKLDHQVSPREDLTKYGPKAVQAGKLTQAQLDMLHRNQSAHANTIEGFAYYSAALILAQIAGVSNTDINFAATAYCVARVAYFFNYLLATKLSTSSLRGVLWWFCNIVLARLIWKAGQQLAEKAAYA